MYAVDKDVKDRMYELLKKEIPEVTKEDSDIYFEAFQDYLRDEIKTNPIASISMGYLGNAYYPRETIVKRRNRYGPNSKRGKVEVERLKKIEEEYSKNQPFINSRKHYINMHYQITSDERHRRMGLTREDIINDTNESW